MPVYWRRGGSATFDPVLQNSPITKLCFVIAFSPFGRRTSFPNQREESLVISSVGEKSLNCVPWCILPLICYCVFFLLSFCHVLLAPKRTKRPGTRAFESRVSRLVNCVGKQYNSFDTRLPLQACLSVTGCCGS